MKVTLMHTRASSEGVKDRVMASARMTKRVGMTFARKIAMECRETNGRWNWDNYTSVLCRGIEHVQVSGVSEKDAREFYANKGC